MKKAKAILVYTFSFAALAVAIVVSVLYLKNRIESVNPNYHFETVYVTHGDSLHDYFSAAVPETQPEGMLVLNSVTLTPQGYRLAAGKRLIVVTAQPSKSPCSRAEHDSLLNFRRIVSAAAQRYEIPAHRVMIGDFSGGDTVYLSCWRVKEGLPAESLFVGTGESSGDLRIVPNEASLISWASSTLDKSR